ncbi:hypothetical protein [Bacillus pseudomycoides]|nr:hypothetical protein [Bacillus pseudomycoides]
MRKKKWRAEREFERAQERIAKKKEMVYYYIHIESDNVIKTSYIF